MTVGDPTRLFAAAEADFGAGRWAEARAKLDRVAVAVGPHPAVLHLSGLVHRRIGAAEAAVRDLEAAARLGADADVFNNLGNALADVGRSEDALEAHRAAARLRPGWTDAHRNAALTLLTLDRAEEAVAEARAAVAADPAPAASWSVLGRALLAIGRLADAADALDRALALAPTLAPALAARARVALERGEADAAERHERAIATAPHASALLIGAAQANPGETALERLADRLATEPEWLEGHRHYAKLASELGCPVDTTLVRARFERRSDPALLAEHMTALIQAEREADALAAVDDAGADPAALAEPEAIAALHTGDLGRAATALERLPPDAASATRARLALTRRDPAAAAAILLPLVERDVAGVSEWSLLSLAWRILDDPREGWLHGGEAMVSTRALDLTSDELEELARLLRGLHAPRRRHPTGQSLRGGTQTGGRLLARGEPVIARLAAALDGAVEAHRLALPPADPRHPLLRHRDRPWAITGSWSVRLTAAGFHVHHIHPNGIVSSATYVALPAQRADDPHAGWLALGASPAQLGLDLPPTRLIEPAVGTLALFPSTLFHGTVPFADGERLTVAFDVSPR